MTTKTILVVEDEGLIALHLIEMLSEAGFVVPGLFSSGEDLLDYLQRSSLPDAILMDIVLAGKMDGIETARIVRERYTIPVIFLTAISDENRITEAREISPYGYLIKPVRQEHLLLTIERI